MKIKRLFKPGDRVQLGSGGPVMIVQRYARVHKHITGWYESDHLVECSWVEDGEYKKKIFHQGSLRKLSRIHTHHGTNKIGSISNG